MPADSGSVLITGFAHLVFSQVSTRLITFALNLATARLLSVASYGLASVQFHLINTAILFLSREGFRRGCLRSEQDDNAMHVPRLLATAALVLPVGAVTAGATCGLMLRRHGPAKLGDPYPTAVYMQGAAALLELAAEPLYILGAAQLRFRLRVGAEAAATLARGAVTLALLARSACAPAIALSWGQLAYAGVTLLAYLAAYAPEIALWLRARRSLSSEESAVGVDKGSGSGPAAAAAECAHGRLWADGGAQEDLAIRRRHASGKAGKEAGTAGVGVGTLKLEGWEASARVRGEAGAAHNSVELLKPGEAEARHGDARNGGGTSGVDRALLDWRTLRLCASFSLQAAGKLVLAEGSKLVLVAAHSTAEQGAYGLASNLGSLVVRTLFQPFEEAAYLAFSRSGAAAGGGGGGGSNGAALAVRVRLSRVLAVAVRTVTIVGLFAVAFGSAYCQLLLRLAYGERWAATGAPAALAAYCPYILLLAVNGILEAFVHAVAAPSELAAANVALVAAAGAHMAAVAASARGGGGAAGVVAADAFGMALRIAYSAWFVARHFCGVPGFRLRALAPSRSTFAALSIAAAATALSAALCEPRPGARVSSGFGRLPGVAMAASRLRDAADAALPGGQWGRAGVHVGVGAAVLAAVAPAVLRAEHGLLAELRALRGKAGSGSSTLHGEDQ